MKNLLILFLFLISSCGYQPLYSKKNSDNFIFNNINSQGDKKINRYIISAMSFKKNSENYFYEELNLNSKKSIVKTAKDAKGKPVSFKMILEINLKIEDKQNKSKEQIFSKEFSYENIDNKFDLSEYEVDLEKNLIDQIIEEIIIYLNI